MSLSQERRQPTADELRTHKALEGSIAHWAGLLNEQDLVDVRIGEEHCALCIAFPAVDCLGCPLAEAGHIQCNGTPYEKVHEDRNELNRLVNLRRAHDNLDADPEKVAEQVAEIDRRIGMLEQRMRDNIVREVALLVSLRQPEHHGPSGWRTRAIGRAMHTMWEELYPDTDVNTLPEAVIDHLFNEFLRGTSRDLQRALIWFIGRMAKIAIEMATDAGIENPGQYEVGELMRRIPGECSQELMRRLVGRVLVDSLRGEGQ